MSLFTESSEAVRDLWSDDRGWILTTVAAGWFLALGTQLILPAILPHLRSEFDLDLTTAGLLLTGMWTTYAICQFPSGFVGDRIGSGRILVASTLVAAAVVGLLAVAITPLMLVAATILFGLATAPFGPMRYSIISDIYSERDGTAIGLTLAAGNVGNSVLPALAGIIAAYYTWRLGFGLLVPCFVLTAVGLWVFVPPRTGPEAVDAELSIASLRYVARNVATGRVAIVTIIQICAFFTWQGFTGFYPTYLVEVKGVAPNVASLLFGLFFAVGVVVQPLAGAGMDRFGIRPCLFTLGTLIVLALGATPFVHGLVPLVVVTVVLSSLLGFTPVTHTYLANQLPTDMKGRGLGLLRSLFMTVSGTGPIVVGVIADRGHFDGAFVVLAGVCLLALLLVFVVPRD